jgi:hypothetical protein
MPHGIEAFKYCTELPKYFCVFGMELVYCRRFLGVKNFEVTSKFFAKFVLPYLELCSMQFSSAAILS